MNDERSGTAAAAAMREEGEEPPLLGADEVGTMAMRRSRRHAVVRCPASRGSSGRCSCSEFPGGIGSGSSIVGTVRVLVAGRRGGAPLPHRTAAERKKIRRRAEQRRALCLAGFLLLALVAALLGAAPLASSSPLPPPRPSFIPATTGRRPSSATTARTWHSLRRQFGDCEGRRRRARRPCWRRGPSTAGSNAPPLRASSSSSSSNAARKNQQPPPSSPSGGGAPSPGGTPSPGEGGSADGRIIADGIGNGTTGDSAGLDASSKRKSRDVEDDVQLTPTAVANSPADEEAPPDESDADDKEEKKAVEEDVDHLMAALFLDAGKGEEGGVGKSLKLEPAAADGTGALAKDQQDEHDAPLAERVQRGAIDILSKPIVEVVGTSLVLLSSLLVALATLDDLPDGVALPLALAQDVIAVAFLFEFLLRWVATKLPPYRYAAQPLVLVDFVVVVLPFIVSLASQTELGRSLPLWLISNNALITLRLLRILRLQRILQDLDTFQRFERALGIKTEIKAWQLQLARVVLSIFTLLSVATGLIYTAEHRVNPQITDYFTALYFGLTTLTTVGFGDITPVTPQGKLVVSLSILAGVTLIPAQGASLVEALLERQRENKIIKDAEAEEADQGDNGAVVASQQQPPERMMLEMSLSCPNCGAVMHWSAAKFCWSCGNELPISLVSTSAGDSDK